MTKRHKKLTTIAVDEANYLALKNLGGAGDSFNDVLTKLLKITPLMKEDANHRNG